MSNPFKVLGITPEIVRDLKDGDLIKHAKLVYRSLSLVFHPDVGGRDKMAKELNAAIHELECPEKLLAAKNDYIKKKLTKSEKILRLEKQLLEKDKKISLVKDGYKSASWQFLGDSRKMSLVPNREFYLLLDNLAVVRLNPYSPTVDLYNVFDHVFARLKPLIFGFINTELMRQEQPQQSVYGFIKGTGVSVNTGLVELSEESFKKSRASFICTDAMKGSEFVLYDGEKNQYIIIGKVVQSLDKLEKILDKYAEKIIKAMHIIDNESAGENLQLAIKAAKKNGCKDHNDFSAFLGELGQVIKIFQHYSAKKTKAETMATVEEVLNMKTFSWRWVSDKIKEVATDYLIAGKSRQGLVAILKTLSL